MKNQFVEIRAVGSIVTSQKFDQLVSKYKDFFQKECEFKTQELKRCMFSEAGP